MITLQVLNGRIILTGFPKHSPYYSSIPGALWDKKLLAWTYPASPIALARLQKTMRDLGHFVKAENISKEANDLWMDWQRYKQDAQWKTKQGLDIAQKCIEKPEGYYVETPPWAHQLCARLFIENKHGAYLAMDMGTGKTLVMIDEMLMKGTKLNLILCPKSVCAVWADELRKHPPKGYKFQCLVLDHGTSEQKGQALVKALGFAKSCAVLGQMAVIINYESFWRVGIWEVIKKTKWDMIIFDEAHRLKSAGGKASRHAAQLVGEWKRGLSGTPLPNNPLDGYGQWRAIDPALLGTNFAAHRARFAVVETYKGFPEITAWKNQEELGKLLDLQTFKVDKSILNLPESITTYRSFALPPKVQAVYNQMWNDFCTWAANGEEVTAANALARLMKLRQITCGFIIDDQKNTTDMHDEREKLLKDTLEDIPKDEPVVVFCEFTHDFSVVKRVCDDLGLSYGEVNSRGNDTERGQFRDDVQVLAVQPKSGGLGLNLTKSCYNIFFSTGFSLSDHEQAKGRTFRGGQTRHVNYIHLVCQGTVDEQIYKALKDKREVIDFVLAEILGHGGTE